MVAIPRSPALYISGRRFGERAREGPPPGARSDRGVFHLGLLRQVRLLLAFDALVDLLAVYRDALRRIDAYADLISLDPQNRDGDVIADHHGFADPARKNEHLQIPLDLYSFGMPQRPEVRFEGRSVHAVIHLRLREK